MTRGSPDSTSAVPHQPLFHSLPPSMMTTSGHHHNTLQVSGCPSVVLASLISVPLLRLVSPHWASNVSACPLGILNFSVPIAMMLPETTLLCVVHLPHRKVFARNLLSLLFDSAVRHLSLTFLSCVGHSACLGATNLFLALSLCINTRYTVGVTRVYVPLLGAFRPVLVLSM